MVYSQYAQQWMNQLTQNQKVGFNQITTYQRCNKQMREQLLLHFRKVQARNKNKKATNDVKSSSVQVGCSNMEGMLGTSNEPHTQPPTKAPNLVEGKKTS